MPSSPKFWPWHSQAYSHIFCYIFVVSSVSVLCNKLGLLYYSLLLPFLNRAVYQDDEFLSVTSRNRRVSHVFFPGYLVKKVRKIFSKNSVLIDLVDQTQIFVSMGMGIPFLDEMFVVHIKYCAAFDCPDLFSEHQSTSEVSCLWPPLDNSFTFSVLSHLSWWQL